VWDYKFDPGTNLIDVHIGRLRAKLDLPDDVPMIRTVRVPAGCSMNLG